jgi:HK97 family phage major capsid protein
VLAELRQIDADRKVAEGRLADLEAAEQSRAVAQASADRIAPAPAGAPFVQVNASNERVYSRNAERHGVSFFRDLIARGDSPEAADRLLQHQREASRAGELEVRDVGTGAFTGLTVPQYLTELVAPARRANRPVADIANGHTLPASGMTVEISRITTGSAAAAQTAENANVQETDMDDTLLTVDVRTIAGQQDVSRQAIERGTGIDAIVMADLVSAYNTTLDNQIINGSGSSGQHRGIRNVSGIVSVAYTDGSPTAAELYPKIADLIQQVQTGVFMGVSHFVMHPRRWWWITKELSSTHPLVQFPNTASDSAGNAGGTAYDAQGRNIFGVPVVLDANLPTNLGDGTNQDVILGVTADELHLWEDPDAPLMVRAEQTAAGSLTVKLVVYGYSAFTAGRYPGAHGTIGGTGLVVPVY